MPTTTRSVRVALAKYTAEEVLDGENCYKCTHCAKLVEARKQLRLHRTPHVLALQVRTVTTTDTLTVTLIVTLTVTTTVA